jgi:hypothetical protein
MSIHLPLLVDSRFNACPNTRGLVAKVDTRTKDRMLKIKLDTFGITLFYYGWGHGRAMN